MKKSVLVNPSSRFTKTTDFLLKLSALGAGVLKLLPKLVVTRRIWRHGRTGHFSGFQVLLAIVGVFQSLLQQAAWAASLPSQHK